MGISNAMQTGVAGLLAQAEAVSNVSQNIANASTVGYKRTFADMVTTTTGGITGTSGVSAVIKSQTDTAGSLSDSTNTSSLAVSGNGFFVVSTTPNATSSADYFLTRAGDFTVDENGYMVNSAGYYLAGYSYGTDGTVGTVDRTSTADLTSIKLNDLSKPATKTTTIELSGNLDADETGLGTEQNATVSSAKYYNDLGQSGRISMSWQPSATTANSWTVTFTDDNGTAYGSVDVAFNASGDTAGTPASYTLGTAAAGTSVDANGNVTLTVPNGTDTMPITISLGAPGTFTGVTQFAGNDGTRIAVTSDGSAQTPASSTSIDENGTVYAVYSDGTKSAIYDIPLGSVANPNGMTLINGNAYQISASSGDLSLGTAKSGGLGSIDSGSLESSNVEIAQELTDLIRIQRAYSSDAKIITTIDDMLQVTADLKR